MNPIAKLVNKLAPPLEVTLSNLTAEPTPETKEVANTGVMVALFPDKTAAQIIYDFCTQNAGLAAELVTPVDQLHLTLAYLGDSKDLALEKWQSPKELAGNLEYAFSRYELPLVGRTTGIALFDAVEVTNDATRLVEKKRPLVLLFDSPQLPDLREELIECLEDCALEPNSKHGFIPHITLTYLPADSTIPDAFYGFPQQSMLFTEAVLAWGDAHFDLPLLGLPEPESEMSMSGDMMDGVMGMGVTANTMPEYNSFSVKELADGSYRWVAFTASSFLDRDGEIVSQKALEEDVARTKADGDYGPLLWWHVPSYVLGQCDSSEMCGAILVESGTFKTPQIAKAIRRIANDLGMSQAFEGMRDRNMKIMFDKARKTERSMLPEVKASNPVTETAVTVNKGGLPEMKLNDLLSRFEASGMPHEEAAQVVAQVETRAAEKEQQARNAGLIQKETPTHVTNVVNQEVSSLSVETVKGIMTEFSTKMLDTIAGIVDQKLAETVAEQATKETALATVVETLKAQVTELSTRLSGLEGDQPPSIVKQLTGGFGGNSAGYRASGSNRNVVSENAAKDIQARFESEEEKALSNQYVAMAHKLAANMRNGGAGA